jgi:hypothetical protein
VNSAEVLTRQQGIALNRAFIEKCGMRVGTKEQEAAKHTDLIGDLFAIPA